MTRRIYFKDFSASGCREPFSLRQGRLDDLTTSRLGDGAHPNPKSPAKGSAKHPRDFCGTLPSAGQIPPAVRAVYDVYDILLFFACILTYLTTAAFATSLGRVRWLGRGATRAYVIVSFVALLFLVLRGFSYPDLRASSTPWYLRPAFIAGIPAVPWIMPFLLGVVLVRRAGDE